MFGDSVEQPDIRAKLLIQVPAYDRYAHPSQMHHDSNGRIEIDGYQAAVGKCRDSSVFMSKLQHCRPVANASQISEATVIVFYAVLAPGRRRVFTSL